ncbi:MAG: ABC transporter substrate-binding protein [Hyphomicrobiaceae bacterium]|nr:ABC transporter substrate-binding protein [Hyphomicrobiaceae bacterium]
MHRRAFLHSGATVAIAGPVVAAPALAQSAPEIRWRMASSFPKSQETLYGAGQTLCAYLAEATDNKFQIQTYAAGELATSRQALDVVASGAVECAHTPLSFHTGKDMTLAFGTGLPFGLNARLQQSWWAHGGGSKIVNDALKAFGAYGIPAGTTGPQMGGWFKKEINSLDDLKGLRFRINGLGGPIFARVGAVPVDSPHADVLAALESNAIDGAEFLCPHDDERLGLFKAAKLNYGPCWWESAGMVHLLVNLEKWNGLPKAYRAALAHACDAVNLGVLAKYDAINPAALKRLAAAGTVIRQFPQPMLEAFYRAAVEHFGEIAAKDAKFKKAMESANGFLKDHIPWLQASDQPSDAFQIAINGRA